MDASCAAQKMKDRTYCILLYYNMDKFSTNGMFMYKIQKWMEMLSCSIRKMILESSAAIITLTPRDTIENIRSIILFCAQAMCLIPNAQNI